jgi:hypothetical protein
MTYYAPTEDMGAPLARDRFGRLWERHTPVGKKLYCSNPTHDSEERFLAEVWRCIATHYIICDGCLRAREER